MLSHYKSVLKKHHQSFVSEDVKGQSTKLFDSSTIPLCLNMFDWAKSRTAKGEVKIHTNLDVEALLPHVVNISEAQVDDNHGFEQLIFPKNNIIVEDRGYVDFTLMLNRITTIKTFVTRTKTNIVYETLEEPELPEEKTSIL